ncbi:MAG: peptidylprolyl isomerase [Pseudomonadota bacterium]
MSHYSSLFVRARRATLALSCLFASLVPCAYAQGNYAEPLNSIVAVVNNEVILYSELLDEMRSVRDQLRASNTRLPSQSVFEKQVLERVIMMRLQVQAARRNGIRIDDRQLNSTLEGIARQNNMGLGQFRDAVEGDGYDFAQFRERIRSEITINQARQRLVAGRISVAEREIKRYLANADLKVRDDQKFLVAHILFAVPDGASSEQIADARSRGADVLQQLDAGEDFAEMAVAYSDGQNALDGGKLGWLGVDEMPEVFATAIGSLSVGAYSQLVRSASGFHIIQLVQRREGERHVVQQTRARHILLRPGELANEEEVISRLRILRERIVDGESFGALARAHSDDRASALREGDLGWVNPGDTVPAFERQMDILSDGGISEPFRSQFGWHIVQVLERRDHDSTDAVRRAQAREAIMQRKRGEELQNWLRQLRDEAYVEVRLDE